MSLLTLFQLDLQSASGFNIVTSGSATGSGTANLVFNVLSYPIVTTGSASGSGTANISFGLALASTGSATGSGTANLGIKYALAATGSATGSGTANVTYGLNYPIVASGSATGSGTANFTFKYAIVANGSATTSSSANVVYAPQIAFKGGAPVGKKRKYSDNPEIQAMLDKGLTPFEKPEPKKPKTEEPAETETSTIPRQPIPEIDYSNIYAKYNDDYLLRNQEIQAANDAKMIEANAMQQLIRKRQEDDALALLLLM